jgi:N-acyl homoserine lactone hydrolase
MNAPASITITPVRVADLLAEGERMPVYVHVFSNRNDEFRSSRRYQFS